MVYVLGVLILVSLTLNAPFPVFWGVAYGAALALGAWGTAMLVMRTGRDMPAWIMVPTGLSAMLLSLLLGLAVYWQDLLTAP